MHVIKSLFGIAARQNKFRELTENFTWGKFAHYLAWSRRTRDDWPTQSVIWWWGLKNLERQANSKRSKEQHVELWESTCGSEMSRSVSKDSDRVRSLTKSVSRSDWKIMLELWYDYPDQLVINIKGLIRWGVTLRGLSPPGIPCYV